MKQVLEKEESTSLQNFVDAEFSLEAEVTLVIFEVENARRLIDCAPGPLTNLEMQQSIPVLCSKRSNNKRVC